MIGSVVFSEIETVAPLIVVSSFSFCSKPVAMTVTKMSFSSSVSMTEPKIMLASSLTRSYTVEAASLISYNPRSVLPVMLIRTPLAPLDVNIFEKW